MPETSSRPPRASLISLAADAAADIAHIGLVLFLVACSLVHKVPYTNVALMTIGFLMTWPPAAYALLVLVGSGALLLDQDDSSSTSAASRGRSKLKTATALPQPMRHPPEAHPLARGHPDGPEGRATTAWARCGGRLGRRASACPKPPMPPPPLAHQTGAGTCRADGGAYRSQSGYASPPLRCCCPRAQPLRAVRVRWRRTHRRAREA